MSTNKRIEEYISAHSGEMLDVLARLVEIPSVKGEPAANAPFGKEPRRALQAMSEICGEYGFETAICEDVVGSADYNPAGAEVQLGILCHLDVVPAEPAGWSVPPFAVTRRGGVLYGRGVIDDKGPAVASLFAMRCIKDLGIPLKKGVRLIFGTDEENGSEDMAIYRKHVKLPPNVFTPDGSFPVINIEKGMMRSRFSGQYSGGSVKRFEGGRIPNAVPDSAFAEICGISAAIVREKATGFGGLSFEITESGDTVRIECTGKAAHASTPEGGANAVTGLLSLLAGLPLVQGAQTDIIRGLAEKFPFGEWDGGSCGLKASDEKSGELTCVFSIFSMSETACGGCVDVRFPTCMKLAEVEHIERRAFAGAGCVFDGFMGDEPHCVDESSEFVQSLLRVYERCEGEKGRCIAIGGGTYVHTVEGGVAFGAERGDTDYHMHGADEFITVDELLRDAVLFAEAIAEICG
ncbi:MAG: Sapep family Mn(2+)-dependent dipeptidase [Oscillospiraceae bacterium]